MRSYHKWLSSIILFLAFFLPLAPSGLAQTTEELTLVTDNLQPVVGQEFTLTITLKQTGNSRITLTTITIPGTETFQETGSATSTQIQSINGQTAAISEIAKTLIPTQTGNYQLGPVSFPNIQTPSNTITINVQSDSLASSANNLALNANKSFPSSLNINLGQIITVAVAIVVSIIAYLIILRPRKQPPKPIISTSSKLPKSALANQLSLQSINQLSLPQLDTEDSQFFSQVRQRIDYYIKQHHHIDPSSLTSRQILAILDRHDKHYSTIARVMQQIDLGQFGKQPVDKAQMTKDIHKLLPTKS
jgi:hypothetical protein